MADFQATITLIDDFTRTSTKRFEGDFIDWAAALAATAALVVDLDALSMAKVISSNTMQRLDIDGSLAAGANMDAGLTLSVLKEDNAKAVLKVPAPLLSVINADGTADITDALITSYVDNWISSGWYISDGETVTDLLSGKLDK